MKQLFLVLLVCLVLSYLILGIPITTHASPGTVFTKITDLNIVLDSSKSFGVSWVDVDGNGWLDLFVANGGLFELVNDSNQLFMNNGDGTFSEVTNDPIVTDTALSWLAVWGDYNNDGYPDCYVANGMMQANHFYQNDSMGAFIKLDTGVFAELSSTNSASWADYNNDGRLDLMAAADGWQGTSNDRRNLVYTSVGNWFVRNLDVPFANDRLYSHGINWCDFDNDGDRDAYVANYQYQSNNYYRNNGDGSFTKLLKGHMTMDGAYSTGASIGDYDNDGDMDVFVANGYTANYNFLYENTGSGDFVRITDDVVVNDFGATIGSCFGDYDNDGDIDLYIANAPFDDMAGEANLLYENQGDGSFAKVTTEPVTQDIGHSGGVAFADYDRDGDLDLYVTRFGVPFANNLFFVNNGNDNHWLQIELIGTYSNRSAIGARLTAWANINGEDVLQSREIVTQSGYGGQVPLLVHFGLGDATQVDSLIIRWPNGLVVRLPNVAADQFLTVVENCCQLRGDVDNDGFGPNIADLVYLVSFMFSGGEEPACMAAANVDNSPTDLPDIADLVYYVSYMFEGGPPPVACDL